MGIRGWGVLGATAAAGVAGAAVLLHRARVHDAPDPTDARSPGATITQASSAPAATPAAPPAGTVTAEGARLVRDGRTFRPFGYNYTAGGTGTGEYFARPTPAGLRRIHEDFAEAKRLGANTIRIFLELHDFVERRSDGSIGVRADRLEAYRDVLAAAQRHGVLLDVTGNLTWRPDSTPAWYDRMGNQARWGVQAAFWSAIARAGADSPAILCYELTSEPLICSDDRADWYGETFGGYHFMQTIARGVPAEQSTAVMDAWLATLTRAVRSEDAHHMIGVGVLPFTGGPTSPSAIADDVDLLIYHDYPEGRGGGIANVLPNLAVARAFAGAGKPVLLGETAAMNDDIATQRTFLREVAPIVDGTLSFYDGRDPEDMAIRSIPDAMYRDNLRLYRSMRDELT